MSVVARTNSEGKGRLHGGNIFAWKRICCVTDKKTCLTYRPNSINNVPKPRTKGESKSDQESRVQSISRTSHATPARRNWLRKGK